MKLLKNIRIHTGSYLEYWRTEILDNGEGETRTGEDGLVERWRRNQIEELRPTGDDDRRRNREWRSTTQNTLERRRQDRKYWRTRRRDWNGRTRFGPTVNTQADRRTTTNRRWRSTMNRRSTNRRWPEKRTVDRHCRVGKGLTFGRDEEMKNGF